MGRRAGALGVATSTGTAAAGFRAGVGAGPAIGNNGPGAGVRGEAMTRAGLTGFVDAPLLGEPLLLRGQPPPHIGEPSGGCPCGGKPAGGNARRRPGSMAGPCIITPAKGPV